MQITWLPVTAEKPPAMSMKQDLRSRGNLAFSKSPQRLLKPCWEYTYGTYQSAWLVDGFADRAYVIIVGESACTSLSEFIYR